MDKTTTQDRPPKAPGDSPTTTSTSALPRPPISSSSEDPMRPSADSSLKPADGRPKASPPPAVVQVQGVVIDQQLHAVSWDEERHAAIPPMLGAAEEARAGSDRGAFDAVARRRPAGYGLWARFCRQQCVVRTCDFFREGMERARGRDERQIETDRKLRETISPQQKEDIWRSAGRREGKHLRLLRTKDVPENYETIKVIGQGAFGQVQLVRKRADKKVYAIKCLMKTQMIRKRQLSHVRSERDILANTDCPWVVKLFTTFQDADFLYMVMEFLPGGDLMSVLIRCGALSENATRFYMAECVLALEAIHQLGVIHRDIKPSNVLLDRAGHVKLIDFGLATGVPRKVVVTQGGSANKEGVEDGHAPPAVDRIDLGGASQRASQIDGWRRSRRVWAHSLVGTPDYTAPEVLMGSGYSFSCDWWSLGSIMFECLVGWPPFCGGGREETFRRIVHWRDTFRFPSRDALGSRVTDLIRRLICDPEDRLCAPDGIKRHPFFRDMPFERLRSVRAPFVPRLATDVDTTFFPIRKLDQVGAVSRFRARVGQQEAEGAKRRGGDSQQEAEGAKRRGGDSQQASVAFVGYSFSLFDDDVC